MNKKILTSIALIYVLMLAASIGFVMPASADVTIQQTRTHGPRAPGWENHFYVGADALFAALRGGSIDIMAWAISVPQYRVAITDPNIILAPILGLGLREFDINNNFSIASAPTVLNPFSNKTFRQAFMHMVDKDYVVSVICEGFAVRLDVQIPAPSRSWWNPNVTGANYPYKYNLTRADELLKSIGFVDREGDGIRNWPLGWPGKETGPNMVDGDIRFYYRSDDPLRSAAAAHLRDNMVSLGIPCGAAGFLGGPSAYCSPPVMTDPYKNYHIYTGGWSVGRYPTYLYSFYNTLYWFPGGSNYIAPPGQTYTDELDYWTSKIWYANSIPEAMEAALKVQEITVREAIHIPLWSDLSFWAYRNLLGVNNMDSVGPFNEYTLLNAYRADNPNASIRMGLLNPPEQVNQVHSRWVWDTQVLGLYWDGHQSVKPFDILVDQPWRARDWAVKTDNTLPWARTEFTLWYMPGIEWITPKTGEVLKPYTSEDHEFTAWIHYQQPAGWVYGGYKDIHSIVRHADDKITIYWNTTSFWFQYNGIARQVPKASGWLKPPLTLTETKTVAVDTPRPGTTGNVLPLPRQAYGAPISIISSNATDLRIELGYLVTNLPTGTVVTVSYYARGDTMGYHPGGLSWEETQIGTGYFYMTDLVAGPGGYAAYKANPYYWQRIPVKGDVDFVWWWSSPTPPGSSAGPPRWGFYRLDIYDVVLVLAAYGSQGRDTPSPHWQTGADLALDGYGRIGSVTIHDVVILTGQYGTTYNGTHIGGVYSPSPP